MIRIKSYMALIALIFSLSGCISLPARDMSALVNLDHAYQTQFNDAIEVSSKWWLIYNDDELNALMDQAFINNPNIGQIRARLKQAQAATKQNKATLLPNLTAKGSRNEYRGDTALSSSFTLAGASGYELDLWGGNRANANSAELLERASIADIAAAKITLSASITKNWLEILSLLAQERLLQKQIDVNRTVLELQEKRFEMGSSSALDILQQEERLAQSEAGLPDILSQQKIAANNISLLIGNTPHNNLKISEKPFPAALPIPKSGLPSDLLENRPDIVAAWLRLKSSDWAVKSAWADRLPSFNLSANHSISDTALSGIFDAWVLNMAASIAAPIFDGGSRKAEQLKRKAISDEIYHAYREVVLNAVVEVENSLIRNFYQDQKLTAMQKQFLASIKTLEQAQTSYTNGRSGYINVLNSLNNTQSLEQQITAEQLKQAQFRIELYRTLGAKHWAKTYE